MSGSRIGSIKGVDRVLGAICTALIGLAVGGVSLAMYSLTCLGGGFLCDFDSPRPDPTLAGLYLILGVGAALAGVCAAVAFTVNRQTAALVTTILLIGLVLAWAMVFVLL